jgi:hypothetical protein
MDATAKQAIDSSCQFVKQSVSSWLTVHNKEERFWQPETLNMSWRQLERQQLGEVLLKRLRRQKPFKIQ